MEDPHRPRPLDRPILILPIGSKIGDRSIPNSLVSFGLLGVALLRALRPSSCPLCYTVKVLFPAVLIGSGLQSVSTQEPSGFSVDRVPGCYSSGVVDQQWLADSLTTGTTRLCSDLNSLMNCLAFSV